MIANARTPSTPGGQPAISPEELGLPPLPFQKKAPEAEEPVEVPEQKQRPRRITEDEARQADLAEIPGNAPESEVKRPRLDEIEGAPFSQGQNEPVTEEAPPTTETQAVDGEEQPVSGAKVAPAVPQQPHWAPPVDLGVLSAGRIQKPKPAVNNPKGRTVGPKKAQKPAQDNMSLETLRSVLSLYSGEELDYLLQECSHRQRRVLLEAMLP